MTEIEGYTINYKLPTMSKSTNTLDTYPSDSFLNET